MVYSAESDKLVGRRFKYDKISGGKQKYKKLYQLRNGFDVE